MLTQRSNQERKEKEKNRNNRKNQKEKKVHDKDEEIDLKKIEVNF
jgi:hypothetical protein